MSHDDAPYERLSRPFVPPPPRSVVSRAGTRGLRVASAGFLLLFLPGGWLYFNAWAAWTNPGGYGYPPIPPPPVATACHLMASLFLYCAARGIEAVQLATERRPP